MFRYNLLALMALAACAPIVPNDLHEVVFEVDVRPDTYGPIRLVTAAGNSSQATVWVMLPDGSTSAPIFSQP